MKRWFQVALICLFFISFTAFKTHAQEATKPMALPAPAVSYPWNASQLLEPADLADQIKSTNAKPVILNIGAVEDIRGATHVGAVSNAENMELLQKTVSAYAKNTTIVIYCGCCPFTKCPNIRPAFAELTKLGFTHIKVLNLPVNLHTNWTSKGYPLASN